jgi:hypothetical protein
MTARPTSMRRSLGDYIDQVKRKERFLAEHPDATITTSPEASPYDRWRGQVPGSEVVTSHELGQVLDQLDDLAAARGAHVRWPDWTFTRQLRGWQAQQTDASGLVVGRTLEQVEARVERQEHIDARPVREPITPATEER